MITPLPISRATNAFDLLEELKAVIREEPQRLYMGWWIAKKHGVMTSTPDWILRTNKRDMGHLQPACGTVACAAGWIVLLRDEKAQGSDTEWAALRQFPESTFRTFEHLFNRSPNAEVGTPEAAEFVADRIALIQRFYEHDLKAFALMPPTVNA